MDNLTFSPSTSSLNFQSASNSGEWRNTLRILERVSSFRPWRKSFIIALEQPLLLQFGQISFVDKFLLLREHFLEKQRGQGKKGSSLLLKNWLPSRARKSNNPTS